jgi:hypothetical protein
MKTLSIITAAIFLSLSGAVMAATVVRIIKMIRIRQALIPT